MSDQRKGTGWQPLSKPNSASRRSVSAYRHRAPGTLSADPNQRLGRDGSLIVTPFVRLARTHAFHAAGDATVAVALAGSLFFSIDPSAARSRVLLYLVCTLAPFAVVGPLIGPTLDRIKGGQRLVIISTLLLRAGLVVLMIPNIDSLWLFPIAFTQLVLGKTYSIAKAATVPTTVLDHNELVDKNSRLAVLSAVSGFVGAAPAVILQRLFGSPVTLGYACAIYVVGLAVALRLPRVKVDDPDDPDDVREIKSSRVRLAASAMSGLRAVVGFMFFMLAFVFRGGTDDLDLDGVGTAAGAAVRHALGFDLNAGSGEPAWKLGLPLAFWGVGILGGNLIAPRFRERFSEENMILGSIGAVVAAAVAAMWAGGINGAVLLALIVGAAPSAAKLAFDSLVQRDAPGANHGAAFGRFETRFQIAWVLGALVPVVFKVPLRVGFLLVAAAAGFAGATYLLGFRRIRTNPQGAGKQRFAWRRRWVRSTADPETAVAAGVDVVNTEAYLADTSTADPYGDAFADATIEPPDWASAVFGERPDEGPYEPPSWINDDRSADDFDIDDTPPMGTPRV